MLEWRNVVLWRLMSLEPAQGFRAFARVGRPIKKARARRVRADFVAVKLRQIGANRSGKGVKLYEYTD